jgi:hypothetical protein
VACAANIVAVADPRRSVLQRMQNTGHAVQMDP